MSLVLLLCRHGWPRSHQAFCRCHSGCLMFGANPCLKLIKEREIGLPLFVCIAALAPNIGLEFGHIDELALSRRVIHHRHDPNAILEREFIKLITEGFGANLSTQVDMVTDPQETRGTRTHDFIGHLAGIFGIPRACIRHDRADTDRIENGRDPRTTQFAIMGQNGRAKWPIDLGAWLQMTFDIVGVQFHQTWRQIVPFKIDGPLGTVPPWTMSVMTPPVTVSDPVTTSSCMIRRALANIV